MDSRLCLSSSIIHADMRRIEELIQFPFSRVELGFFTHAELPLLQNFVQEHQLRVGIHDPLPLVKRFCYPQLSGPCVDYAEHSVRRMELTIRTAAEMNAEYALFHMPTTLFGSTLLPRMYGYDSEISLEKTMDLARHSCERLSDYARRYRVNILLENVVPNDYFYTADSYVRLFQEFPDLHMCLDIGHLWLGSITYGFDWLAFIRSVAPYVSTIHLWNTRPTEYRFWGHMPVHPSQHPQMGWIDVPQVLALIYRQNRDCITVFEYAEECPFCKEQDYLTQGFEWVEQLIQQYSDDRYKDNRCHSE